MVDDNVIDGKFKKRDGRKRGAGRPPGAPNVIDILHRYRRLEFNSADDAADQIVALFEAKNANQREKQRERHDP